MSTASVQQEWHPTACILCSLNCGIEVQIEGERLARVRGDERHPRSEGYLCQKASRLDYYQNHADRLDAPLRRRPDGSFERISWETAIREIAGKLVAIREEHGGRALAYYGGGGQGNHLGGVYGHGLVEAMRTRYHYSALAQEKTGDFWVNGRLFGRQTCHMSEAVEEAEVVVIIGANPWQAHGIRNARTTLHAITKDPARTLIVIDPRRTETAAMADVHLPVRPGTDAFLLAAILATIVRDGLENRAFLDARTTGYQAVRAALLEVPVEAYAARAGVAVEDVVRVARRIATAKSASVRVDLGLQQSLHSTLNSYLEKLLALVPGHFGRPGCNALHTFLMPLIGHSEEPGNGRSWTTTVTGLQEIGKLFPPNVLPAEIDTDHPGRIRGLVVDSANPALSGADTQAYRAAFSRLELLVVIDVALTETARHAHYVLPAASQLEKWETTFFSLEFPTQVAHLRRPLFAPRVGTLPEPEIYRRLLVAMGELPAGGFPLLRQVAKLDRRWPRLRLFPAALAATFRLRPKLRRYATFVLADTLGKALPHDAAAVAPLWGAAHVYAQRHPAAVRRTGLSGEGADLGEALFERLLESPSGAVFSTHQHDDTWSLVRHADRRVHLEIPEMLEALRALAAEAEEAEAADFPMVLIAGERRSYNANQIYRDPNWRKTDREGALHIHPDDARHLGLADGALAVCESSRSRIEVRVTLKDSLQPGVVTLPHGYGQEHPDEEGVRRPVGPVVNLLTDSRHRDPLTATPYHKHVRVRVGAAPLALQPPLP